MHKPLIFLAIALLTSPSLVLASDQMNSEPVAYIDDAPVTMKAVAVTIQNKLLRLAGERYWLERRAAQQYVDRVVLAEEASKRGLTEEELLCVEVDAKVRVATAEEIAAAVRSRPRDEEAATSELRAKQQITREATAGRLTDFMNELRAEHHVHIVIDPPRVATPCANCPTRGPASAPVRIDEFSDFQCPYCSRMAVILDQVLEVWPDQIQIVFHDFPLVMHHDAIRASLAGRCALRQDRFWPMHDAMFAHQTSLSPKDLRYRAEEAQLDLVEFDRCMAIADANLVKPSLDAGIALDISGTPTIFINGIRATGASIDEIEALIDEELSVGTFAPRKE
jgi:predicted DsbA family dithiol-disulfide isomerase